MKFVAILILFFSNNEVEHFTLPVIADSEEMCIAWIEGAYGGITEFNGRRVLHKKSFCEPVRTTPEFMDIRGQMKSWKQKQ